jgi:hypothetical protein
MAVAYVGANAAGVMSLDVAAGVDVVAYSAYGLVIQRAAARAAGQSLGWLPGALPALAVPAAVLLGAATVADRLWPGADLASLVAHAAFEAALFGATWAVLAALRLRSEALVAGDARTIAGRFLGRLRPGA